MSRRKGFTLVELLVVIAIIALLMAILMPALARVRKQALAAACMVQMKQWATIYSMYTGDFDGYFIPDYYEDAKFNPYRKWSWPSDERCDWWEVLESYYKDRDLLCCPSAKKVRHIDKGKIGSRDEGGKVPFCAHPDGGGFKASYSYNGWLGAAGGMNVTSRKPELRWQTVNRIKYPNTVPVIGDTVGHLRKFVHADTDPKLLTDPDMDLWDTTPNHTHEDRILQFCICRHGPENNPNIGMAFADFSVRPVGLKALWSLKWHRGWVQERKGSANKDMTGLWPEWMKSYSEEGVINYTD